MQKQKRDAEATKAKILTNAIALFSKKGFDATTLDDIAKASDVNKALVYYYFKNKSGLYSAVMSNLFNSIHKEMSAIDKNIHGAQAELKNFIAVYTSYAMQHSYFPSLLLRELSDSGAHLPEMMFASLRQIFMLLSEILQRGEEEGVFAKNIPMLIHFMIIGSINLFVTTEPLRKKAYDIESIDTCANCTTDEISQYIYKTIEKGLRI